MKTNYQMLVELNKEYTPARQGIVSMTEIYLINEKLHLDEMDKLQLMNLRDFTVMFFNIEADRAELESRTECRKVIDKMSAIVSVIDQKLFNIGAEI